MERYERRAFHNVISERTLRVQAEFELGAMKRREARDNVRGKQDEERDQGNCQASSAGGTTVLFEDVDSGNVELCFEKLSRMGKKEHWLIDAKDVQLEPTRILGHGGFGVVIVGAFRGSLVAVKVSRLANFTDKLEYLPALLNELRVLRRLRHPNIVIFHGALIDVPRREMALLLELVAGKTLNVFIKMPVTGDPDRYYSLLGISRALHYLHGHSPAIIHGDLKPNNIIVEKSSAESIAHPKLLDFGLARVLSRHVRPLGGTTEWLAPEIMGCASGSLSPAADVFALGRIMHFVVTGKTVFEGTRRPAMTLTLKARRLPQMQWSGGSTLIPLCQTLAESCTAHSIDARPSIGHIHMALDRWAASMVPQWNLMLDSEKMAPKLGDFKPWNDGMQIIRGGVQSLNYPHGAYARDPKGPAGVGAEDGQRMDSHQQQLGGSLHAERGSASDVKLDPQFASAPPPSETPFLTQAAMVMPLMERWHCSPKEVSACCAYHVAAKQLKLLAQKLIAAPCAPEFTPVSGLQCPQCLAVTKRGVVACQNCDVCGQKLPAPDWVHFQSDRLGSKPKASPDSSMSL